MSSNVHDFFLLQQHYVSAHTKKKKKDHRVVSGVANETHNSPVHDLHGIFLRFVVRTHCNEADFTVTEEIFQF